MDDALVDSALSAFLLSRVPAGDRLCIALSGGMDSVVLLHACRRLVHQRLLGVGLFAVHVHHGISSRADAWAAFCVDLCQRWDVPLEVLHVHVPRDSGEGLEGAARRLRHDAFSACPADWLALAHHRDDQAETVLLNLLRGAGVAGAAGMLAERRRSAAPTLLRPFLEVPRQSIQAYAQAHELRWVEDESNADRHFRRNFLRHEILPRLETPFPGAGRALARAAAHFADAMVLLDDLAALDFRSAAAPGGRIKLGAFNTLSAARARNLLRHAWASAGFRAPDSRWVEEARKQLATADALSEVCVATSEGELQLYRGELYIVPRREFPLEEASPWSGQAMLPWAGGRVRFVPLVGTGIRQSLLIEGGVWLRRRSGGERLRLDARRPRRHLRNLLQEGGVPPWERIRMPLLWVDERLAWVGGVGHDAAFACPPGEAGILPVWEPDQLGVDQPNASSTQAKSAASGASIVSGAPLTG